MINQSKDLARIFRAESGRVLSVLIAFSNDLELAEDALQDACLKAVTDWSKDKTPANKGAWLLTVAKRKLIDRLRQTKLREKQQTLQNIIDSLPTENEKEANQPIPDERLKLIFTCCHPALKQDAQVALTLKTLCGFTTKEIARAYLISEVTMNQRIVRAKRKIKLAGIPYVIPQINELPNRIDSALSVIYLIFNEAYSAYEGQNLTRIDLANEAIRLARLMLNILPQASTYGLLSLMLFHHSRVNARSSKEASFIPLEYQNRKLWSSALIEEADQLLETAINYKEPDKYQIQAAISSLHSSSKSWKETDWPQILLLYKSLYRINKNPIVLLNHYVALAHSGSYQEAKSQIENLRQTLIQYQPFYVSLGYINRKLENKTDAIANYQKAIDLTKNSIERDYLKSELESC